MSKEKTKKEILCLQKRVEMRAARLSASLEELSKRVSEELGEEYLAELCGGCEIEFRRVSKDVPDDYDCVRMEEILNRIC